MDTVGCLFLLKNEIYFWETIKKYSRTDDN